MGVHVVTVASTVETALTTPRRLVARSEVLAKPSAVPAEAGIYGWYFQGLQGLVPMDACHEHDGWHLAYAGISPKNETSTQTLRARLRYHFNGNAEGSTLRFTLGCLLQKELGLELRRVGSGNRLTFHAGEPVLNEWMSGHARVVWCTHPQPWTVEPTVIRNLDLPLNLQGNDRHAFSTELTSIRARARRKARELDTVD